MTNSVMTESVLYATYGDIELVIPELLGRNILGMGRSAILHGVELCVQKFTDVPNDVLATAPAPVSPRGILASNWDEDFRTYAIRETPKGEVPVRLHELTPEEREIILEEWNLASFGWFHDLSLTTTTVNGGEKLAVVTDAITVNQMAYPYASSGYFLQPPLNGTRSIEVATKVRREYLDRTLQDSGI